MATPPRDFTVRGFVVLDLRGVLVRPGLLALLEREGESHTLVSGFFQSFITKSGAQGALAKVERGEIPFTQFLHELENAFKSVAAASRTYVPSHFSAAKAFTDMLLEGEINWSLLRSAAVLRNLGYKTCVLTNNWVDDSPGRHCTARIMCMLHRHFDYVIESCRIGMRKPERRIYRYTLDKLQAKPHETFYLDDNPVNLRIAREMGMLTILFQDTETTQKVLQNITGVQLMEVLESCPAPCSPNDVAHGYVQIRPGVQFHYVEKGNGYVICLCHGFPESWYSWRYQIVALVDAGYRVIALDMKGYGESTAPLDVEEYCQELICKDMVVFLNKLGIPQVTFIGHDWGGIVAWNMALFYPARVRAVVGVNTPYTPCKRSVDLRTKIEANPMFDYQLYFQDEGVAEAELEENLNRTFKVLFRGSKLDDHLSQNLNTAQARERGGFLAGTPDDPPLSKILREEDLKYYVRQFEKTGFRAPLNWYRNIERNWTWGSTAEGWLINVPALMVTAGKDKVLTVRMSSGMEEWIPQLQRGHIEECGHWTLFERPSALNEILTTWLESVHANTLTCSKL